MGSNFSPHLPFDLRAVVLASALLGSGHDDSQPDRVDKTAGKVRERIPD
jgi:hypothetical protein